MKFMLKKARRFFAVALAMISAISLCACHGKKTSDNKVPTLVWYLPLSVQTDQAEVFEKVNEITEKKIGARVDLQFIDSGAYKEKMNMNVASNEPFDLCFTASWSLDYVSSAQKGAFLELDNELLNKYAKEATEQIPAEVLDGAKINGKLYAMPNYQIVANSLGVFTYQKYADKYGFDMSKIKNLEDIEPYLEIIKQNEPDVIPYRPTYTPKSILGETDELLELSLISIPKGAKGDEVHVNWDAIKHLSELYIDWYQKGYIAKDINTKTDDETEARAGRYAFQCASGKPGVEQDLKLTYGADVAYAEIQEPYVAAGATNSAMTAIGKNSKNPEKALELINLVNTDKELYNLLCYGIEGKHYTKTDNGHIALKENSGYAPGCDWVFGCQFNAYIVEGKSLDVWEENKRWNETAEKSPLNGFVFDKDPVKVQITSVSNAREEYHALFNGSIEPSKCDALFEEYKSKMYASGLQEVIDEYRRQVDEWLKTK